MNFGMIATGNHCDFNALRAAPPSLHNVGNLSYFRVIARSEATWQFPKTFSRGEGGRAQARSEVECGQECWMREVFRLPKMLVWLKSKHIPPVR